MSPVRASGSTRSPRMSTPSPRSRRTIARAEAVVAHPADERRAMAEPGETDRHVRLGPRHVAPEVGDLGKRALLARHERGEALPEGDDLSDTGDARVRRATRRLRSGAARRTGSSVI